MRGWAKTAAKTKWLFDAIFVKKLNIHIYKAKKFELKKGKGQTFSTSKSSSAGLKVRTVRKVHPVL